MTSLRLALVVFAAVALLTSTGCPVCQVIKCGWDAGPPTLDDGLATLPIDVIAVEDLAAATSGSFDGRAVARKEVVARLQGGACLLEVEGMEPGAIERAVAPDLAGDELPEGMRERLRELDPVEARVRLEAALAAGDAAAIESVAVCHPFAPTATRAAREAAVRFIEEGDLARAASLVTPEDPLARRIPELARVAAVATSSVAIHAAGASAWAADGKGNILWERSDLAGPGATLVTVGAFAGVTLIEAIDDRCELIGVGPNGDALWRRAIWTKGTATGVTRFASAGRTTFLAMGAIVLAVDAVTGRPLWARSRHVSTTGRGVVNPVSALRPRPDGTLVVEAADSIERRPPSERLDARTGALLGGN
jgi:hypothetical protein